MKTPRWPDVVLLLSITILVTSAVGQSTAGDFYNQGIEKQNQGDLAGAIASYDKAIELKPDFFQAYGSRAGAKVAKGDFNSAIIDYDKEIELKPSDTQAWFNRAVAQQAKGDPAAAVADYTRAIELQPNYAKAFYNRGNSRQTLSAFDEAIADYGKAIELKPDFFQAYNNRANARQAKGDLAAAITDYDKALEMRPDLVVALDSRGNARQAGDDFEGALADFEKCIALSKNDAGYTRIARALILARLHRGDPLAELAGQVGGWRKGWAQTIGQFLTGTLAEKDFLDQAGQGDARTIPIHQCEALYYAGMAHLLKNDSAGARDLFVRSMATGGAYLIAFSQARVELARLAPKP